MAAHNEAGRRAEQDACEYLQRRGLRLVERNYRCARGEIDLIMRDRDTLVFVEVRFRRSRRYGGGVESVDWRKQDRLAATAAHYLQQNPRAARRPCRFDVIAIGGEGEPRVDWISDAFQV